MSHRRILSVNDIISHLEDNDDVLSADIYITPPDNYDKSDEDSGDEESSNINHLSRQQLLAQAEFRATVSSQSNLDIIESVSNEVSIDNNTHGDLSVQPPAKKKNVQLPERASTGNTHPELGVGASVVLDLISKLPPGTYSFYMDNYFTSLPLLDEIKTLGPDATGTVRANRVEKAPLKEAKDMKKMSRGSFDQCTDTLTNITLVRYNDNNIVTVASTECGVEPLAKLYKLSPASQNNQHDYLSFTRHVVTTYLQTFPENSSSVKKPIPRSSLAVIKRVPVDISMWMRTPRDQLALTVLSLVPQGSLLYSVSILNCISDLTEQSERYNNVLRLFLLAAIPLVVSACPADIDVAEGVPEGGMTDLGRDSIPSLLPPLSSLPLLTQPSAPRTDSIDFPSYHLPRSAGLGTGRSDFDRNRLSMTPRAGLRAPAFYITGGSVILVTLGRLVNNACGSAPAHHALNFKYQPNVVSKCNRYSGKVKYRFTSRPYKVYRSLFYSRSVLSLIPGDCIDVSRRPANHADRPCD
ncbi:unnamed protein product [Danaus chrysippus]|uniref:(African queen) hypothetical protein n=1 Tax=Danaus chrysippus TaxID=151541 RepID=A0A8J2QVD8_9NEOP|nr:unnamed protein product [Danaus chrysippus]